MPGSQSAELVPGSSFLWNLATWNQRNDDLRGVNAIAVIGNAGTYTPSSLLERQRRAGIACQRLGGVRGPNPLVTVPTRIVPYCHVDPGTFTNTGLGTFACSAARNRERQQYRSGNRA